MPQGRGTGQPGSKNNFSQINFVLLLNFEPSKYIAIKKSHEEKLLQGCLLAAAFSSGEISTKALEVAFGEASAEYRCGGMNI